ncbi:Gfo/Idh/MocA family protein [Prosthecobacter dejongeii]|uniref:Putative dehydrogenase n=1 Tax=Prosthecobacter dejongeii TaxID=48465 RepID=A0A7W7YMH7_9BACT|nr:Gfo/Idh/MocA family oxidoreductase [Prosthecobacter dejongeii]MBB5038926.1 putative dehydrogenase [Prosthecobacter dejongeii]
MESAAQPFRIGVAGVGAIGKNHARIMAEIAARSEGGVVFAAVYDADPARAADFAAQYNTQAASDLGDFASRVDAATVAVPTIYHRRVAEPLMEKGVHVMVEKPISESYAEAQAMIELAQAKNVILQVGHIERFNPVLRQLEERMDQPRFIEVHRLSPFPNRSMDIGVVLDVMIHDIEIVLHLVKSPLIQIDAVGIPVLTKREDIANARLKFANGCIANITASRISPEKMRKIRVFQQDSYLSLDYQEQSGWIYRKDGMQIVREAVEVEKDEPLKLEIAAFVECSRHGKRPVVTGQEGAEAVRIALEITDQIEKNAALAG